MTVPFALSVHNFIKNVGADAGFASIIGLALLVLLYFAQMRETATLHDRLEEAIGRVGQLENRLAHLARAQTRTAGRPAAPPIAPRPELALRPMGSAIASVQNYPANAVAGGVLSRPVPVLPGAPAGVAAPALSAATKLIPTPAVMAPASVPAAPRAPAVGADAPALIDDTMLADAAAVLTGANGHAQGDAPPVMPPPVGAFVSPVPAGLPPLEPNLSDDRDDLLAGGGPPPLRFGDEAVEVPRRPAASRLQPEPRRSRARGIAFGLIALAIVAVGVVLLLSATRGATVKPKSAANGAGTRTSRHHHVAPLFNPASVTVAVLNGTAVNFLAKDVGNDLANRGYKEGPITNAAVQTQATSVVGYLPGDEADAVQVAKALKLRPSSVQAAGQSAVVACAANANPAGSTTTATSCPANVIVTVGADLTSAGTST